MPFFTKYRIRTVYLLVKLRARLGYYKAFRRNIYYISNIKVKLIPLLISLFLYSSLGIRYIIISIV